MVLPHVVWCVCVSLCIECVWLVRLVGLAEILCISFLCDQSILQLVSPPLLHLTVAFYCTHYGFPLCYKSFFYCIYQVLSVLASGFPGQFVLRVVLYGHFRHCHSFCFFLHCILDFTTFAVVHYLHFLSPVVLWGWVRSCVAHIWLGHLVCWVHVSW